MSVVCAIAVGRSGWWCSYPVTLHDSVSGDVAADLEHLRARNFMIRPPGLAVNSPRRKCTDPGDQDEAQVHASLERARRGWRATQQWQRGAHAAT